MDGRFFNVVVIEKFQQTLTVTERVPPASDKR